MLRVSGLSKSFGARKVLDGVSFLVNPGDRVGIVGPNGAGKSTLARIVAGLDAPDSGSVWLTPGTVLGYLPQDAEAPLAIMTVSAAMRSAIPGLEEARLEVDRLARRLSNASEEESGQLLPAYGDALTRFEVLGGYEVEDRLPGVLAELGLEDVDPATPVEQLSGGQQARVRIAGVLLADPDLMVLDEPTNHLDLPTLEWLEGYLEGFSGAALVISHDRVFLDKSVTRIIDIDGDTGSATVHVGNYSSFVDEKVKAEAALVAAYKDQQAEISRMRADISRHKEHARQVENSTIHFAIRKIAKGVAKTAKSRERRLERYMASPERVEMPKLSWRMKLEFAEAPRGGELVATLDDLRHQFESGEVFHGVNATLRHGERIALLGPNGCGKSTLLRILAGELEPTTGRSHIGTNIKVGYMPQQHAHLDPSDTPFSLVNDAADGADETEVRNFLHFFLFEGDEVFTPVGSLSHGERARLVLASLVVKGANLLLLDEPVNHLDITSRERFETALLSFPGTVVAAVHDRAFVDTCATAVWSFEADGPSYIVQRFKDRMDMSGKWRQ